MGANEDEMARNIALARELYYSGKLGPMGPPERRRGPPPPKTRKIRRRSSTGSISVNPNMPINMWSMEILKRECNMELVVPLHRRRSDISTAGNRLDHSRRRSELKQASRSSFGSTKLSFGSELMSVNV